MSDWYEHGLSMLMDDLSAKSDLDVEKVRKVFTNLTFFDVVDYDLLKEVILNRYFDGGADLIV